MLVKMSIPSVNIFHSSMSLTGCSAHQPLRLKRQAATSRAKCNTNTYVKLIRCMKVVLQSRLRGPKFGVMPTTSTHCKASFQVGLSGRLGKCQII